VPSPAIRAGPAQPTSSRARPPPTSMPRSCLRCATKFTVAGVSIDEGVMKLTSAAHQSASRFYVALRCPVLALGPVSRLRGLHLYAAWSRAPLPNGQRLRPKATVARNAVNIPLPLNSRPYDTSTSRRYRGCRDYQVPVPEPARGV